jgi:hypothetical protein
MTVLGVQGIRSTPVARIVMGEDDLRPPFLAEVNQQFRLVEAAVALAQATVRDLALEEEVPTLLLVSDLFMAIEAAIDWAAIEFTSVDPVAYMSFWPRRSGSRERLSDEREAKKQFALKVRASFDERHVGESGIVICRSVVDHTLSLAKQIARAGEWVDEFGAELSDLKPDESGQFADEEAEKRRITLETECRRESAAAQVAHGESLHALQMGLGAVPVICGTDPLPVLRIRHESPVELIVALVGGAGGLVAVLNQILDLEIKLKTRHKREEVTQANLERELAESEQAARAARALRPVLGKLESEELALGSIVAYDNFEQALEDDHT